MNKGELIEVLTKNRKQHKDDFDAAFKGYQHDAVREMEEKIHRLCKGERVELHCTERLPDDHTPNYDLALDMLNMSVDSVVELTSEQFNQFVNDKWDWKERWTVMNSKYIGK